MSGNLFYSVSIESSSVAEQINGLIEYICDAVPRATWTTPDKLHVTLQFLGAVPSAGASERLLRAALAVPAGNVSVQGSGYFLNSNGPRVLYVNLTQAGILRDIREELGAKGMFTAHLTLAKLEDKGDSAPEFFRLAREIGEHDFGSSPVSHVHLLRTQGADLPYEVVSTAKLTGKTRVEAF